MEFIRKAIHGPPSGETEGGECAASEGGAGRAATLLVIQADAYDWAAVFRGCRLRDGRSIEVVQTGWDKLSVSANSPRMSPSWPIGVDISPDSDGGRGRTIKPDFLLVRNEVRGALPSEDHRNALFGMMFAGLPSVNSLSSVYRFLERPIVQAELNEIEGRLGSDAFPLIPQSYFARHSNMMYGSAFPCVLKVGHAHAGAGKMRVRDHHEWEDVRSVVMMTEGKYCTAEPFIEGEYDLRIQKIGDRYRAYKRRSVSGTWKTNTGCSVVEEIPLAPHYKAWADEASKIFGGLDICTVDAICEAETGKEYILEVNGTSSGLLPERSEEDNNHIRDIVLKKMNEILCPSTN